MQVPLIDKFFANVDREKTKQKSSPPPKHMDAPQ